ncbi:hypothetical protein ACFOGJ_13455 [Marinibaculum pumilum]|uniref:Uncharacterized protein n=1 Tax=Marinibaculum pumilum TaxID=1766165 RepID=A0ABV7L1M5_9PROT
MIRPSRRTAQRPAAQRPLAGLLLAFGLAGPAMAGEVEIVGVTASPESGSAWRFDVTLRHDDTGWEHYADKWEVRLPDGTVLGRRVLLHPHVDEQPFTRSLAGVEIPADIDRVIVHAHDKVHGWSPQAVELMLER